MQAQPFSTADPAASFLTRRDVLIALALAALAIALFAPAIGYDFVNYDDDLYVYENPSVLGGLSGSGLQYALTSGTAGTWAPVTWLSYQADTTLLGALPRSYHTTNIMLHAAAGALMFLGLRLMRLSLWVSATVAGVFLLHPLRTESVAWIAERKDVLCAFFWALGLVAYAQYARKPGTARWLLVFLCFLGGAMSKMMMATFPFVLLLLDVWPLNRVRLDGPGLRANAWPLVREKIPLFLVSGLVVLLSVQALQAVDTLASVNSNVSARLWRVPVNYVFYLGKIFWPADLSVIYPTRGVRPAEALLAGSLLAVVTVLALWRARRMPWLLVGWLWFLGTLVPVIGFVTYSHFFVGDRYTYIPSLGLTLAVAGGLEHFLRRFETARWAGTAVLIVLCMAATRADLPRWRNTFTLYEAALRIGPHHVTYNNRGTAFLKAGDLQRALADFDAALALKPNHASALNNRGSVRTDLGDYEAALKDCSEAIRLDPTLANAWNNRGNVFTRLGQFNRALEEYQQAIQLKPGAAVYYNNRAAAYFSLKQYPQALADLRECEQRGGQPHPGLVQALREATQSPQP